MADWLIGLIVVGVAVIFILPGGFGDGIGDGAREVGEGAGKALGAGGDLIGAAAKGLDDFLREGGNALKKLCFWC